MASIVSTVPIVRIHIAFQSFIISNFFVAFSDGPRGLKHLRNELRRRTKRGFVDPSVVIDADNVTGSSVPHVKRGSRQDRAIKREIRREVADAFTRDGLGTRIKVILTVVKTLERRGSGLTETLWQSRYFEAFAGVGDAVEGDIFGRVLVKLCNEIRLVFDDLIFDEKNKSGGARGRTVDGTSVGDKEEETDEEELTVASMYPSLRLAVLKEFDADSNGESDEKGADDEYGGLRCLEEVNYCNLGVLEDIYADIIVSTVKAEAEQSFKATARQTIPLHAQFFKLALSSLRDSFVGASRRKLNHLLSLMFPVSGSVESLPSKYDVKALLGALTTELSKASPNLGGGDYGLASTLSVLVGEMVRSFVEKARQCIKDNVLIKDLEKVGGARNVKVLRLMEQVRALCAKR